VDDTKDSEVCREITTPNGDLEMQFIVILNTLLLIFNNIAVLI